jgi:uncharacterized protein YndB with AHSA1/START domain
MRAGQDEMTGEGPPAPEQDGSREQPEVRRQVDVEASPEEVFEALVTEEGRDRWLEEPDRQIHIESADPPHRLVWWWVSEDHPATRVDFRIVALPPGDGDGVTRVIVTESAPSFPLASLVAAFEPVFA